MASALLELCFPPDSIQCHLKGSVPASPSALTLLDRKGQKRKRAEGAGRKSAFEVALETVRQEAKLEESRGHEMEPDDFLYTFTDELRKESHDLTALGESKTQEQQEAVFTHRKAQ